MKHSRLLLGSAKRLALSATATAVLAMFPILSEATTFPSAQCNNCSLAQRQTAAINLLGGGAGTSYVHDLASGVLYKYQVNREPGFNGTFTYTVVPRAAEPGYQEVITALKGIYDANNHSLKYRIAIKVGTTAAAGPAGSAFDVVDPGAGRTNTINYVRDMNHWPIGQQIIFHYQLLVACAHSVYSSSPSIQITFEVDFADGSKADFQWSYDTESVSYVNGTAYDSHGNPIPQSRDDIVRTPNGTQRYDYSGPGNGNDLNQAQSRFNQLGVPVSGLATWACTKDPYTGIHCVHPL
jgi:hypothetical protein